CRASISGCAIGSASAAARSCTASGRRWPRGRAAWSACSPTEMRVVPLEAFRDRISFAVAVSAVERAFRALALGEATLPDPMVVELAEQRAEVHVKGAHLRGARHIVLKLATGFYNNRA